MRLGLGLSICDVRGSASVFNPATLSLTGWWRASYAASPWVGTASAGTSGTRDLTEATNPPAAGSALNSLTPADFDGTNDRFYVHAWTSLFSLAAGTAVVLFNADADAAEITTNGYDEPTLIGSADGNASMGLSVHISGGTTHRVRAHIRDSGGYKTRVQTYSLSSWNLATLRWDSSNMKLDLNSLSTQTIACGAIPSCTNNTLFGNNYTGTLFFNGRIAEFMTAQTALADADVTNIKTYVNSRYGLAL